MTPKLRLFEGPKGWRQLNETSQCSSHCFSESQSFNQCFKLKGTPIWWWKLFWLWCVPEIGNLKGQREPFFGVPQTYECLRPQNGALRIKSWSGEAVQNTREGFGIMASLSSGFYLSNKSILFQHFRCKSSAHLPGSKAHWAQRDLLLRKRA